MITKKSAPISASVLFCLLGVLLLSGHFCMAVESSTNSAGDDERASDWESLFDKTPTNDNPSEPPAGLVRQFVIASLIVVVMGGGVYYFSKKLVPKFATTRGKDISVIETIHIGPRKTLHLVDVGGNQKLLIGSTAESINILADVTPSLSELFNPGSKSDWSK